MRLSDVYFPSLGSSEDHHHWVSGHHHHHCASSLTSRNDCWDCVRAEASQAGRHLLHQPPEDQHVWSTEPGLLWQGTWKNCCFWKKKKKTLFYFLKFSVSYLWFGFIPDSFPVFLVSGSKNAVVLRQVLWLKMVWTCGGYRELRMAGRTWTTDFGLRFTMAVFEVEIVRKKRLAAVFTHFFSSPVLNGQFLCLYL